ncbi:6385_t:CDS:2 [Scutellospora calospora]|uniref:6385_t:CDS:1 n=1 Tax=Scutellospora calospora TaxID=85575 RepID=A0ACA9K8F2_9GLOM|nr:6385_t:CDS:2 [Scutellospora calospora]
MKVQIPIDIVEILLAEIEIVDIVGQIGWIRIGTIEVVVQVGWRIEIVVEQVE